MSDLDKAREWAESLTAGPATDRAHAAAKVIQSLPNAWVDVEKVRELLHWREVIEQTPIRPTEAHLIALLHALITPKLPTLADMTQEERKACQWMQCAVETDHEDVIGVIRRVWSKSADVIFQSGQGIDPEHRRVTPLPDLPKLKWPGGTPDDVAYATGGVLTTQDVVDECRAVRKERANTAPTLPRPEDVPANEPWLIEANGQKAIGTRYEGNAVVPWSVAALNGSFAGDYNDNEITLIYKLVPEPPALPEGMRLADHAVYGRVVTSPKPNRGGIYDLLVPKSKFETGADWEYAHECELTFLGGADNG